MRVVEAVLAVQQIKEFAVKNLPRKLARLIQNGTTKLSICIVSKVPTFVEDALANYVQHYAPKIVDLAIILSLAGRQMKPTIVGNVQVHRCRAAVVIKPASRSTCIKRHCHPIASIVERATHFDFDSGRAEMFAAHDVICLKAAGRKHNCISFLRIIRNHNTRYAVVFLDKASDSRIVADRAA